MKIYKISQNLTIEDLDIDLSQFNENQIKEIKLGIKNNLTKAQILIYAKLEFTWEQMYEIRKGLEKNLNVEIYAKLEFNWKQMEQIRFGLEDNLNVEYYAKPEFTWEQMYEIRQNLKIRKQILDDWNSI